MKINSTYNINKINSCISNKYPNRYKLNSSQEKINFCARKDRFELSKPKQKKVIRQFKPQFIKEKTEIEYFLRQNGYSPEHTESVIKRINGANLDIVQRICDSEIWRDIYHVMQCLNKDNIDFVRKLCSDKNFPKEEISGILLKLKDFNIEFAKRLCFDEKFPKELIGEILSETTKDNIHFAEKLCFTQRENPINYKYVGRIISKTDEDNIDIAETLCFQKKYQTSTIDDILDNIIPNSPHTALIRELLKYDIPEDSVSNILWKTKDNKEELIKDKIEYAKLMRDKKIDWYEFEYIITNSVFPFAYYLQIMQPNKESIEKTVKSQKERCLKYPELYCNGVYDNYYDYKVKCNDFFDSESNDYNLKVLADVLGAEALNDFLGYRFDVVKEYFEKMQTTLNYRDLKLLKEMVNAKKLNGQNFISKEKVNLIDTFLAYKNLGLNIGKIEQMVSRNCLDTNELHFDILKGLFIKYGLSRQEFELINKDILFGWDLKYIQLLEEEMKLDKYHVFLDVIKGANTGNFKTYIHDKQNKYGIANKRTQKIFEAYGLDYASWLNPPQNTTTLFQHRDKTSKILSKSAFMIANAVEELRRTPAKDYIDKVLSNCIKSNQFVIPDETAKNKEKLTKLVSNILCQLNKVWERAFANSYNTKDRQQAAIARKTMSIQFTLAQIKQSLLELQKVESKKNINWKIKMWDRNPQKDLFQGNYSNCCIGINKSNGNVMPGYLLNTMFNMMEIVDNDSGKTIGNALVYYAKDKKGNTYFVIDNVEIHNHYKKTSDIELELRDAITEFAQKINIAVTKKQDTPVIIGEQHNDITLAYLSNLSEELSPIGCMECKDMYLDLFGGRIFDTQSIEKHVDFADLLHPICK